MAQKGGKRYRYRTNTQDLDWQEERADASQNIGDIQRLVSAIAGTGLIIEALRRRSVAGGVMAVGGLSLLYRAATGYCPALGAMGIDMRPSQDTNRLGRRKVHSEAATKISRSVEVKRPPNELYRFWRTLDNLPKIMSHLESVHVITDRLSHWVVKTMTGLPTIEWDAEIINDVENERIGWRSLNDADVDHAGSVEFEPIGKGQTTRVTVTLQYAPIAGRLGTAVAKFIGEDPELKIADDLQRFKESMEAGNALSSR
ncbi:MAG TPA: SRPBCC family protein [Nitrospira sp.]|nr:SRPBCC family protein [Nitrospira sp.]